MTLLSSKSNQPCLLICLWASQVVGLGFPLFVTRFLPDSALSNIFHVRMQTQCSDLHFFPLRKKKIWEFGFLAQISLLEYSVGQTNHLCELLVHTFHCFGFYILWFCDYGSLLDAQLLSF